MLSLTNNRLKDIRLMGPGFESLYTTTGEVVTHLAENEKTFIENYKAPENAATEKLSGQLLDLHRDIPLNPIQQGQLINLLYNLESAFKTTERQRISIEEAVQGLMIGIFGFYEANGRPPLNIFYSRLGYDILKGLTVGFKSVGYSSYTKKCEKVLHEQSKIKDLKEHLQNNNSEYVGLISFDRYSRAFSSDYYLRIFPTKLLKKILIDGEVPGRADSYYQVVVSRRSREASEKTHVAPEIYCTKECFRNKEEISRNIVKRVLGSALGNKIYDKAIAIEIDKEIVDSLEQNKQLKKSELFEKFEMPSPSQDVVLEYRKGIYQEALNYLIDRKNWNRANFGSVSEVSRTLEKEAVNKSEHYLLRIGVYNQVNYLLIPEEYKLILKHLIQMKDNTSHLKNDLAIAEEDLHAFGNANYKIIEADRVRI